jgi:hypothetical protein
MNLGGPANLELPNAPMSLSLNEMLGLQQHNNTATTAAAVPATTTATAVPAAAAAVPAIVRSSVITQQAVTTQLNSHGQGPLRKQLDEQSERLQKLQQELKKIQEHAKEQKDEAAEAEDGDTHKKEDVPKYYYTQREFWGGPSLSYMVYTMLAIFPITGFLGMDHMYMRSPGTGLLKAIMNIITLGFWYFYDVVQAVTDQESVSEFGVSMPLYGPSGIGAGSFLKEGEAKVQNGSPGSFLMFAFATFFLPFGIEYIFAGDYGGFTGKFLMSFLGIGLVYGILNSLELLQHPERVMCRGTRRFWPITWFAEPVFKDTTFGNHINDNCPEIDGGVGGWFSGIFGNLIKKVPILGELYEVTTGVIETAVTSVKTGVGALGQAAELAPKIAQGFAQAKAATSMKGGSSSSSSGGSSNNGTTSSTILTFTLALVFIGAAFLKGKDVMTAMANKADGRLEDVGKFIWRKKNVFDLPPAAPKS